MSAAENKPKSEQQLIFFSENAEDKKFFESVCSAAAIKFREFKKPDAVCGEIALDPSSLVVVDASTQQQFEKFEKTLGDSLGFLNDAVNPNRYFFVGPSDFYKASYILKSPILGHYIPRSFAKANIEAMMTLFKIATGVVEPAPGVARYCGPNAKVQSLVMSDLSKKPETLENIQKTMEEMGFKVRVTIAAVNAVDELLLAMHQEAILAQGVKKIALTAAPDEPEEVARSYNFEFQMAVDGENIALCIKESGGTLDKKKFLSSVVRAAEDVGKLKSESGLGAIDFSFPFRHSSGVIFECNTGQWSQIALLFKKTDSFLDAKQLFRSLSTFTYFTE